MAEWDGNESSCSCDCGFDIPKGGHLDKLTLGDITGIANLIYPIGSIYMSVNSADPSTLFGGTWEQIEDKFILSAGSTFEAGSEGGAESFDLSVSHKHVSPLAYKDDAFGAIGIDAAVDAGKGKSYRTADIQYNGTLTENVRAYYTAPATVSATIPTLPPYLTVYVWKRTA